MQTRILRGAIALALIGASTCALGAQRTFVSPDGSDSNPCSVTLPCRGFATAMAATSPNGEIVVLGSAGYGAVSISQPVKIIAPAGVYAGITVAGGSGVTITGLASTDTVVLRGLTINGQGGSDGVSVGSSAAGTVRIEDCNIDGFSNSGINHGGSGTLYMSNVTSTRSYYGIIVGGPAVSTAVIERSRFNGNMIGVAVGFANVSVRDSDASGNAKGMVAGFSFTAGQDGYLDVERSTANDNTQAGIAGAGTVASGIITVADSMIARNAGSGLAAGASDVVRVSNSTIVGNLSGVGSTVISASGNAVLGNTADNSFVPAALPKQ